MKIYLSGQMKGLTIENVKELFAQAEQDAIHYFSQFLSISTKQDNKCISRSYIYGSEYVYSLEDLEIVLLRTINPCYIQPIDRNLRDLLDAPTYDDYMRADIVNMMDCNAIWMLNNWKKSKGATLEHDIAKFLHFQIGYQPD